MTHGFLGIPEPWLSAEYEYNTSKAATKVLVGSLLGGINLNYLAHKGCVCTASTDRWKHWEFLEKVALTRMK